MKQNKKVGILGVPVNAISKSELKSNLKDHLKGSTQHNLFIATVNASFVLMSQKNSDFMSILNRAGINTPDGVSIQMAGDYLHRCRKSHLNIFLRPFIFFIYGIQTGLIKNFKGQYTTFKDRITGVFLSDYLLELSNTYKYKVVVVHREDSITSSRELVTKMNNLYPHIDLKVIPISLSKYDKELTNIIQADVVFCTFGEYKQEKFLSVNKNKIKAKVTIGIGSALDVIIGKVKIDQSTSDKGLEWLNRLINNPKRFRKIFISVVVFPAKLYLYSLKEKLN